MSKVPFYFTKYHRGLLLFLAKGQTKYLFKIVSTTGTLLPLVAPDIKNTANDTINNQFDQILKKRIKTVFFSKRNNGCPKIFAHFLFYLYLSTNK